MSNVFNYMFKLLNLESDAFGIDISNLSAKLVKLNKTNQGFDLVSHNCQNIEQGIIDKGEIKNKKRFGVVIKNLLNNVSGEKLRANYAAISLPEQKSFLKTIKMPNMSPEDLEEAVYFEIENHIPLPIEDVYFDFQVVPRSSNRNNGKNQPDYLEVLLTAMPKKTVDSYIFCLKRIGIQPILLEVESLAFAKPCNLPEPQYKGECCPNRFYTYGVIARLALLAAARENYALN